MSSQSGEFRDSVAQMEEGVSVALSIPQKKGNFFSDSISWREVIVWLRFDSASSELSWATLEQRQGQPVEEGRFPICDVVFVNDKGSHLELWMSNQSHPMRMKFDSSDEKDSWARYMRLAVDVLTPESDRAALEAARREHRHKAMEERQSQNEERKKKLSENLGMRYTAEAMMNRSS